MLTLTGTWGALFSGNFSFSFASTSDVLLGSISEVDSLALSSPSLESYSVRASILHRVKGRTEIWAYGASEEVGHTSSHKV